MPTYTYRCPWCNNEWDRFFPFDESDTPVYCSYDGCHAEKVLSIGAFHRSMPAHYNMSVGKHVSNIREFKDDLKRASETASQRTGIAHNFTPIDMRDPAQTRATEDGLETTRKRETDTGQREAKKWL